MSPIFTFLIVRIAKYAWSGSPEANHVGHQNRYRKSCLEPGPLLPFSKLNKLFFGYLHPEKIFKDHENKYFSA